MGFICDWPVRIVEYVPHDRRPPALTVRAQVKSRETPPASATINLKNALRYSTSETPYFVIVYVATIMETLCIATPYMSGML